GKMFIDHPMIKLTDPGKFSREPCGTNHWLKDNQAYHQPAEVLRLPVGVWHAMEVTVRGDTCQASIDKKPVVDVKLDPDQKNNVTFTPGLGRTKGRIGFQTHTGTVRFRRVEVKELPLTVDNKVGTGPATAGPKVNAAIDGFVPLFNGKDLTGWKESLFNNRGQCRVEDGVMVLTANN